MVFCQQKQTHSQKQFQKILQNIRNAKPQKYDWDTLMTQTNNYLSPTKREEFDKATHLFATNELVKLHNKKMVKKLNLPIALNSSRVASQTSNDHKEDEQLQQEVLLCIGQQIMLTTSLWIQARLVNGSLG